MHQEKYRNDSDEEILNLFRVKDENPVNMSFVEENGKKTLAQVFTDIRYPLSTNEKVSTDFLNLLEKTGFLKI